MSDPVPLLSAHHLRKVYLERVILDDVTLSINEGDRIGLLGANGAGKSTLMGILTGRTTADGGEVRLRRGIRLSILDQSGDLRHDWTVGQTIESAFADVREMEARLDQIHHALEAGEGDHDKLLNQLGDLQHHLDLRDPHTIETRRDRVMAALGVPPSHRRIGDLSGGEQRRTALCRTLLEDGDLLLLDEPTNHLDVETLDWLENYLQSLRGTLLFVTHDRYFLDRVATSMLEVWRGRAQSYPGNYTDYLLAKEEEFSKANRAEATRQNLLRREIDWMRRHPKARTTKSKSRMDRAEQLLADKPLAADPLVRLLLPSGPRLGNTLIEAENISYSINGRKLIDNFSFLLGAGDRVGVVGRNGLGKTTLLRLLLKEIEPNSGKVTHGPSVRIVYGDQQRTALDPDKTVLEEVAGDLEYVTIGDQRIGFRTWLRAFLFDEQTAAMPIRLLSGGEQNRVQLAKMLRTGGNVVVMDEPTNDLDLPSLRVLEEALANFDGCTFLVSHDRYFLNRVVNRLIVFQGEGKIVCLQGNYDDYLTWLAKQNAAEANPVAAPQAATTAPPPLPAAPKKKLSYREQQEYETIEKRIAEAEAKLEALTAQLEDPATYAQNDAEALRKLTAQVEAARLEAEQLVERWMELSERA